jgi:hypothetical protein
MAEVVRLARGELRIEFMVLAITSKQTEKENK